MKKRITALSVAAGLGIGGVVGAVMLAPGASNAQSTTTAAPTAVAPPAVAPNPATTAEKTGNEATETHDNKNLDRTARGAQEGTDGSDVALLANAKITPAQAAAAAIALAPGAAGTPDIHDRDNTLTYKVEVTTATGVVEVQVDANTGKAAIEDETNERHGRGHGRSNTDAAHEAAETPAQVAEEAARDAQGSTADSAAADTTATAKA